MSGSIDRALRVIAAHPNVVSISNDVINSDTGTRQVDVAIRLGLPNAWMAEGHSPNGIRSIEPVTFLFPESFPLKAPILRLRGDFDRSLAHVRPGEPGDRPEPCVFEGNLTELLLQQDVAGIINQLVVWLENAALERLINPAQGWEPVRRDGLRDFIIADAAVLRALVSRKAGYAAFGFEYWSFSVDTGAPALHGEIGRERLTLNPKTTHTVFSERSARATFAARLAPPGSRTRLASCRYARLGVLQRCDRHACDIVHLASRVAIQCLAEVKSVVEILRGRRSCQPADRLTRRPSPRPSGACDVTWRRHLAVQTVRLPRARPTG